jgi:hypothetical protein
MMDDSDFALAWKPNWKETRYHFLQWWRGEGMVLSLSGPPAETPHEDVPHPGFAILGYGDDEFAADPERQAAHNHYHLSRRSYPGDTLPLADFSLGPGTLSVYLGANPVFTDDTVWYKPCITDDDPSRYPPIHFDPENRWWKATEHTARLCAAAAEGKYMASYPDLIENIDALAALRDTETLLIDMAVRPEWVEEKLWEINRAWFEVFERLYEIIQLPDGSSAFSAFAIWGPGKTAKLQCDASAMFSPAMFDRFVVPALTEQCEWLDQSLYHLDGIQCECHLDSLLAIDALDGVEWTPDPTVPKGGDARWYPMYRKILDAGKCVQAVGIKPNEVEPLLDAVGAAGMYISCNCEDQRQADTLVETAEKFR